MPILVGGGPARTLAEFESFVRSELAKANLPPLTLALGLADLGPTLTIGDLQSVRGPTVIGIATALHIALNAITENYPLIPTEDRPFRTNVDAAVKTASEAEGVIPDDLAQAQRTNAGDLASHRAVLAAARRALVSNLCEGYAYQSSIVYRVANTLVLLGLKSFRGLAASSDEVDSLFNEFVGLRAYDYVLTLFALWSLAVKGSALDSRFFLSEGPRRNELIVPVGSVIEELARDFDKYRLFEDLPQAESYTGKARACAFFSRWPLIRLNEHQFIFFAHPFFKIQIASKSVTKALALARKRERGEPRTAFSQWLGGRLEAFFSELCELWRPGEHFPEYEYIQGQKSPDQIVFERHGSKEVACLFQLKAKMLTEAAHFGSSDESVRRDLAGAFSETLYKTIQFIVRAEAAARNERLKPENAALTRRILGCERFCMIGIVPDMPSVFTFRDMREILLEEVESHLEPGEREWFRQHFVRKCVWHVMELEEFERFLSIPQGERQIYKRITGYLREADPAGDIIKRGLLPSNFRSYLIRKFGRYDAATNERRLDLYVPELRELFNEFAADARKYFSTKATSPGT